MKRVVIHPDYMCFSGFIDRLPEIFHNEGKTLFKERNEIKLIKHHDLEFVVKSFKKPHLINQLAYTTIRASKAKRAYLHALILKEKAILTPTPVAYIEIIKFGLLFNSYFVAQKSRFDREIRTLIIDPDLPEADLILTDLARFTADIHQKGVFHKDYSSRNILFGKVGVHYEFELVDLNRMKFCEIDLESGCKNLNRLCFNDDMYRFFINAYVTARNVNVGHTLLT